MPGPCLGATQKGVRALARALFLQRKVNSTCAVRVKQANIAVPFTKTPHAPVPPRQVVAGNLALQPHRDCRPAGGATVGALRDLPLPDRRC